MQSRRARPHPPPSNISCLHHRHNRNLLLLLIVVLLKMQNRLRNDILLIHRIHLTCSMSSEIVVGSSDGILEAKMQLELPSGPRIIKCFAGTSLLDVQNALVTASLMTAGQKLVKGGGPVAPLSPDTPIGSLNRCKLKIVDDVPEAAAAPSVPAASSAGVGHGRSSPPPDKGFLGLNQHVGIDAAELEKRKLQMVADMKKREDEAKRILAAHEQEQKDRALEKKMIQDKIIADEQKKRSAVETAHAPLDRIIIGDTSAALVAKIRVQTQGGGIEVSCYDADATMGTLRMIMVGKGMCTQDTPFIQAMQQLVSSQIRFVVLCISFVVYLLTKVFSFAATAFATAWPSNRCT
jgi:hypothetical protein